MRRAWEAPPMPGTPFASMLRACHPTPITQMIAFNLPAIPIARIRGRIMETTAPTPAGSFLEEVELQGHIIDSLILPKVLDEILTHGGTYALKDIRIGQSQADPSYARIQVRAAS